MAERQNVEVNIKTKTDDSDLKKTQAELAKLKQQLAELKEKQGDKPPVSAAFAALEASRNAARAGYTEAPFGEGDESRLYTERGKQLRQRIQIEDRHNRELEAAAKEAERQKIASERVTAGFNKQLEGQPTVQNITPDEDPARQQQLYTLRGTQQRIFIQGQDRARREAEIRARSAERERIRQERINAGFSRQVEAQGTTEELATPEEDPRVQARLYQSRIQQERSFREALQRANREGRIPSGGGAGPQGPNGPPLPPDWRDILGGPGPDRDRGGGLFDRKATSAVRFLAALSGLGVGLSVYYFAGRLVHDMLAGLIQEETNLIQANKNLQASYGDASKTFNDLIERVSRGGTGAGIFKVSDIQNTIAALKPLQDTLHLTSDQIDILVEGAAHLADIHAIPLTEAAKALSEALQGNTADAEKLGLSLNDVTVATRYNNGQYAASFQLLTQNQQATIRLAEAQSQVQQQVKNTNDVVDPLQHAVRELATQWENFNKILGAPALAVAAGIVQHIADALGEVNDKLGGIVGKLGEVVDFVQQHGDAIRIALSLANPAFAAALAVPNLVGTASAAGSLVSGLGRGQGQQQAVPPHGAPPPAPGGALAVIEAARQEAVAAAAKKAQEAANSTAEAARRAVNSISALFAKLAQDAPQLNNQLTLVATAVRNTSTLTPQQQQFIAARQAELAILKQQQILELQHTSSQYSELAGVKELTKAYNDLGNAQSEINRLNLEGTQLAGQLAQAQLNALQANRAVQDNDLRLTRDRLVATDRLVSAQERAAARRDLRQGNILQPDLQLRALNANAPQVGIQRQQEVNDLLTRIATATESRQQQQIDMQIAMSDFTVNVHIDGGNIDLPDDAKDRIAAAAHDKLVAALNSAVGAVSNRPSRDLSVTRGTPY